MGGSGGLERGESTACTLPGLRLRSPGNPEEESPAGNPDTGLPLQTREGVSNSAACLGMSACTACTPPGLKHSTACQGMSACTPSCLHWEGVVVLKELIFILKGDILGGCGGLERTDFYFNR